MLRTNSKIVKEKVRNIITESARYLLEYKGMQVTYLNACALIRSEVIRVEGSYNHANFTRWSEGLPNCLCSAEWLCKSAVDFVGNLLEETEEEKARFTEQQAEALADNIFFMNI